MKKCENEGKTNKTKTKTKTKTSKKSKSKKQKVNDKAYLKRFCNTLLPKTIVAKNSFNLKIDMLTQIQVNTFN